MKLEDLNRELSKKHLGGFWDANIIEFEKDIEPSSIVKPFVWKWSDIYDGLLKAGDLVSLEKSERRTIRLFNPGVPKPIGATTTIHMSVQLVKPGEAAKAHRHTLTAIRFVLMGSGGCTTVEGEQFAMLPGDLILTPNWTWHDHFNSSDEGMVWLDGHDGPLIKSLELIAVEMLGQKHQPVETIPNFSLHKYGHARLIGSQPEVCDVPFRFPWVDTYRSLQALAATKGDPYEGILLNYVNPQTNGPTVRTIGCAVQMLRPGEKTKTHRHTASTIYHAFRGSGCTIVNDERLEWSEGDCFTVPLWSWHSHEAEAEKESILFSLTDRPMKEALGLYREQRQET